MSSVRGGRGSFRGRGNFAPSQNNGQRTPRPGFQRGRGTANGGTRGSNARVANAARGSSRGFAQPARTSHFGGASGPVVQGSPQQRYQAVSSTRYCASPTAKRRTLIRQHHSLRSSATSTVRKLFTMDSWQTPSALVPSQKQSHQSEHVKICARNLNEWNAWYKTMYGGQRLRTVNHRSRAW